jgi:DNA-binding GntR family transcriptional regulator
MGPVSERAADRAYRMIRGDILSGTYPGGTRLGEAGLAEHYGFSRTPVREALRRLQAEGMVEVAPHRGARVVDWDSVDIAAVYDLRAVVEAFVARRAALLIGDDEIDRLSRLCDRMEQTRGDERLVEEFHEAIALAAGGETIVAMRAGVVLPVPLAHTGEDLGDRHHRELLAAFRARDPDWAESVMHAHVHSAKSRLLRNREDDG